MRQAGLNYSQIARAEGVTRQRIEAIAAKLGLPSPMEVKAARIQSMRSDAKKLTAIEMAAKYEMTEKHVYKLCARAGFHPRPQPRSEVRAALAIFKSLSANNGDSCWPWPGKRAPYGYGEVPKSLGSYAHRMAWRLSNGQGRIPRKMCVCHHCDNPPCVNPAHLFLGSYKENIHDSIKKGRFRPWGNRPKKHVD